MANSNGKSSGSWKAWKTKVAHWIKLVLIGIAVAVASLLGLFIAYKSIHAIRIAGLNKSIGAAKAELATFSY